MILLFLIVQALATSPELHELIHADAKDVHHQCVVTVLAHGQVDAPACNVSVPVPEPCFELISHITALVSGHFLELLPPGRAPPFPA